MKHNNLIQTVFYLLLFLTISIVPGCKKSSTEPEPAGEDKSELLVSSLSIALVQGGMETVLVHARDKNDNREDFVVTSEDENIATVSAEDSAFTVTGMNYGNTNLIITSHSGKSRELPV